MDPRRHRNRGQAARCGLDVIGIDGSVPPDDLARQVANRIALASSGGSAELVDIRSETDRRTH
jgi:hypothetical protein